MSGAEWYYDDARLTPCTREGCTRPIAYEDGRCYWHTLDRDRPTTSAGRYRLVSREIRRREAVRRESAKAHQRRLNEAVGRSSAEALLANANYTRLVLTSLVAS